jgi:hypothetical protein
LLTLAGIDSEVELASGDERSWQEVRNVLQHEMADESENHAELGYQRGIAESENHELNLEMVGDGELLMGHHLASDCLAKQTIPRELSDRLGYHCAG